MEGSLSVKSFLTRILLLPFLPSCAFLLLQRNDFYSISFVEIFFFMNFFNLSFHPQLTWPAAVCLSLVSWEALEILE